MDYKGYKITESENQITIENVRDFNPVHIFECGQCFRWIKQENGSFTGVAKGRVANISFIQDKLIIKNTTLKDFKEIWFEYLDLGTDYGAIKKILSKDEILKKAIEYGYGIRILKQDIWEALISFIISANNRIPMIMKTVGAMAKVYGEKIEYDGKLYYSFPAVEKLSSSSVEELEVCRGGFRCKYIVGTSILVKNGDVNLFDLGNIDTDGARTELTKFPGVGNKVADCTLLYSGTKQGVFPTDVWVKRVMEELYFKREASFREIQSFAKENFGEYAGMAQQYLFYYARENKIGVN